MGITLQWKKKNIAQCILLSVEFERNSDLIDDHAPLSSMLRREQEGERQRSWIKNEGEGREERIAVTWRLCKTRVNVSFVGWISPTWTSLLSKKGSGERGLKKGRKGCSSPLSLHSATLGANHGTSHPQAETFSYLSACLGGWFLHVTWANGRAPWMPVVRPSLWYDDVGFTQRYVPRTTTKIARSTLAPLQGPLSAVMRANLRVQCDATPARPTSTSRIRPFIKRSNIDFYIMILAIKQ